MKHKRLLLNAILLMGIGLCGLEAQSTLYVKEKAGTQTPNTLSSIKKLSFPSGNLAISKKDGSTSTFALNSIRYLSFTTTSTDVQAVEIATGSGLSLYPNPVADQLQISYHTVQAGSVQLAIVNMQGSIVQQQSLSSQSGINQATILVAQLPVGLYILRLQSGTKLETIKFYKN